jgi:putative tricarboxylic transport membrane protein
VVAPPGIPKANVTYWEGVFRRLTQTASWKKYLADNQFDDGYQTSGEVAKFYDQFTAQMRSILKEAGVKTVR